MLHALPMQRPVPAPDHGSLTKHMAFASSRQHGNPTIKKKVPNRLYPIIKKWGSGSSLQLFRFTSLAEPSVRGKRAMISKSAPSRFPMCAIPLISSNSIYMVHMIMMGNGEQTIVLIVMAKTKRHEAV